MIVLQGSYRESNISLVFFKNLDSTDFSVLDLRLKYDTDISQAFGTNMIKGLLNPVVHSPCFLEDVEIL